MDITIKSNGHIRDLKAFWELPESARAEFDYLGTESDESNDEHYDARFFQYRGSWYDVQDGFDRVTSPELSAWDGAQGESYFSAVLIRYPLDWDGVRVLYDAVVVGYAHW